jgi:hypothetical protein
LTFNGWPLLVLGTDQCLDDNHFVHSMIPIIFASVRSEPQEAYEELFKAFPDSLHNFYGISKEELEGLHIAGGVCDHSFAIA